MLATSTKLTYAQFLKEYPEDCGRFQLINGEFVKMEAIRAHKNVARFLMFAFNDEIRRLNLNYIVEQNIVFRTVTKKAEERGRNPDVSVVKASLWNNNVMSYESLKEPIDLAVEVVSTNWDDDYIDKLEEYEILGISEYWIVDYLAIGSRNYLGNPKIPTVFIYNLINGEYQGKSFTGNEQIISQIFPELKLTLEQIIQASGIINN